MGEEQQMSGLKVSEPPRHCTKKQKQKKRKIQALELEGNPFTQEDWYLCISVPTWTHYKIARRI